MTSNGRWDKTSLREGMRELDQRTNSLCSCVPSSQRATRASVTVEGEIVGGFETPGLVVLLGVTHDDGPREVEWMANKIPVTSG